MSEIDIFNKNIFEADNISRLKKEFQNSAPFKYIVVDNFFEPSFTTRLSNFFPSLHLMKTHYDGLNEKKAEDASFEKRDSSFLLLHNRLSSSDFISFIEVVTGINGLSCINDRLGYGLHQGGDGSFLDIHIDYNIHPINKVQRRLNFIFFLNAEWQDDWCGNLEFWDSEVKNCVHSIAPLFNRVVIFECSEISYHGYSKMHLPNGITRKSYYHYFFTEMGNNIKYHDTIFKPRPQETYIKKVAVTVKEYLKNTGKKILMKVGLIKLLK